MTVEDQTFGDKIEERLIADGVNARRAAQAIITLNEKGSAQTEVMRKLKAATQKRPGLFPMDLLTWTGDLLSKGDDLESGPPAGLSITQQAKAAELAQQEDHPQRVAFEVLLFCDACAQAYRNLT